MSQTPRNFRPYDRSDDDAAGPDTKTRRIDPSAPKPDEIPWQEAVGSANWRSDRRRPGTTPTPDSGRMPAMTLQRATTWLSKGGWKFMAAGAVALLLLLIFLLAQNKPAATNSVATRPTPTTAGSLNANSPAPIEQADPNVVATQVPTVPDQSQPPASTGARFAVSGTGTEGLFLREQPGGTTLKTLPEGSPVEKLGEQEVDGVLWFNVREAGGLEGWSSSQFLVAAP